MQGPLAEQVLAKLVSDTHLSEIGPFEFQKRSRYCMVKKHLFLELGIQVKMVLKFIVMQKDAAELWKAILDAGKE